MSSGRPTSSRGTLRSITPARTTSISGPIPAPLSANGGASLASSPANTQPQQPMGAWGHGRLKIGGGASGVGANGTGARGGGVGGAASGQVTGPAGLGTEEFKEATIHPLKEDWTFYYVHRPPGAKVIEYEKEIRTIASFGSTEGFWSIYSHLLRPSALPAVTDLLMFASHVRRPVWEELPNGGKWVVRLRKGVADRLWESSLLALLGRQFDDEEGIVGVVLSVRSQEDILSVWSDREGDERERDGVRDKLVQYLGLPPNTGFEYKSNRTLLEGTQTQHHSSSTGAHGAGNHDRHMERNHHGSGAHGLRTIDRGERENGHGHGHGHGQSHHNRSDGRDRDRAERGEQGQGNHGRSGLEKAGLNGHGVASGDRRNGQGFSREDGGGSPWSRR